MEIYLWRIIEERGTGYSTSLLIWNMYFLNIFKVIKSSSRCDELTVRKNPDIEEKVLKSLMLIQHKINDLLLCVVFA